MASANIDRPSDGSRLSSTVWAPAARALGDEAGGGIDVAAGADRDEQIARANARVDLLHPIGHLAEPDDVRPHAPGLLHVPHDQIDREIRLPGLLRAAMRAQRLQDLAMHVDEVPRARPLVQRIDVLGDRRDAAREVRLEPRQRPMRGVGPDAEHVPAAARCRSPAPLRDCGRRPPASPRPRCCASPRCRPCRERC